jgi:hypothetical protein
VAKAIVVAVFEEFIPDEVYVVFLFTIRKEAYRDCFGDVVREVFWSEVCVYKV